jgi:hypothetical protein
MSSPRKFSDVAISFNEHLASLDSARKIFEEEVETFNDQVRDRLIERCEWSGEGIQKVRWRDPELCSSARQVAWLNWSAETRIRLDILLPRYQRFKNAAAFLYFRTIYSWDAGKFCFDCLFTNQNNVNSDLDEEVYRQTKTCPSDWFPRAEHIKRNNTRIFQCELESSLFEESDGLVDRSLEIVAKAVDALYPDSQYSVSSSDVGVQDDMEM